MVPIEVQQSLMLIPGVLSSRSLSFVQLASTPGFRSLEEQRLVDAFVGVAGGGMDVEGLPTHSAPRTLLLPQVSASEILLYLIRQSSRLGGDSERYVMRLT